MQTPTPDPVTFAFVLLAAGVAALAAWGVARAGSPPLSPRASTPRLLVALGVAAAWMILWAVVARSGAFLQFTRRPSPFLFVLVGTLGAGLALGLSPLGGRLARGVPLAALVAFQGFRLPLELIMHRAARAGAMPVQMSFDGYNFDVITGVTALAVAALLAAGRAPRWLVVAWNVLGIALLINIVTIAVASTPLIRAFGTAPERVNTWVATSPFVWLPTVFVALAIAGHIVVTRRLLADR